MTESSVLYATPDPTSADAETAVSTLQSALDAAVVTPVATVEGCRVELDAADVGAVVVTDVFAETTESDLVRLVRDDWPALPVVLFADRPSTETVTAAYDAGVTAVVDRRTAASDRILVETLRDALPANPSTVERTDDWSGHETILDTISDGVYALDSEERFVAVNEAYTELTGFSREELLGRPSSVVTDRLGGDEIAGLRRALADGDSAVTFETDLPTVDGRSVPIEARVAPFTLGSDDVGRVGVVRDVSERRQLERELDGILERVTDAFFAIDDEWRFSYVNERAAALLERPVADLRGESVWEAFPEAVGTTFETEYRRAVETGESVTFEEFYPPLAAWFEVSAYPSETGLSVYFRDVTDRKQADRRREERIRQFEALNERAQRLTEATTRTGVCETTVEAANDVLDLDRSYVALYDDESGGLTVAARTDATPPDIDASLFDAASTGPVWESFIRGDVQVLPDFVPVDEDVAVGSLAVFPLGEHGAFVTMSTAPDAFEETDLLAAELLCANARSSLDRAAREADLRRQRDRLEAKNDRLERVHRINRAIREITQVLVRADSHEEVERLVCEKLAAIDPFRFVWFGHHDGVTDELRPVASAGDDRGYLDDVVVTVDESPTGQGPAGRAVRTGDPAVQNSILQAPEFEPWREAALSRGFRSSISVPVQYRDTQYGVLSLYSGTPNSFEEMETTVLAELGQSIGYAANAIERKKALASERSVEFTFDLPALDAPLFGFIDGSEGRFELENAVRRLDGRVHLFFTARGVEFERIRHHAETSPTVERLTLLSDGEACRFECTVRETTFVSTLLDRGAVFEAITVDDGAATVSVRSPHDVDVRGVVRLIEERFGRVELRSRRELDEPVLSRGEFEREVRSRLTDRQSEVIETAYAAGFFEWPRRSNGQEVAELLDVTQPTVNRHIRAAERRLLSLLFDDGERP